MGPRWSGQGMVAFQEGCDHLCPFAFGRLSHLFRNGGRGCWDLPAHLDVGRLTTRLVEGAPASTERVVVLLVLPGCGDRGMLLSSCGDGVMLLSSCGDAGMLLSSCKDGVMLLSSCGDEECFCLAVGQRDAPAPCVPRAAAPKPPSLLVVSLSCASCRQGARGQGHELVAVKRLFNTAALIFLFVSVSVLWTRL